MVQRIRKTPGVCGGDACIRNSRIPVWTLIQFHRLGRSTDQLLSDYPSLTKEDIREAEQYYREHPDEIDRQIASQELDE